MFEKIWLIYWYGQVKENGSKNIVLGIAGNKCDLYENEAVPEQEAREFADKIGAIFELTSAQNNTGINELFQNVGNKYLDPNFQQKLKIDMKENGEEEKGEKVVLNANEAKDTDKKKKKGGFC